MTSNQGAYVRLHIAVLCWSFTAILGALISISAISLVWWRVLFAALFLLLTPKLFTELKTLSFSALLSYAWIGVLIALHWVCFYASIKLGNASIGLITLATTSLFTALLEPWMMNYKHSKVDLTLGLLIIPAMWLATTEFDSGKMLAFWIGILSAFLLAFLSIKNRQLIDKTSPLTITFIEMGSALIFLTICSPFVFMFSESTQIIPGQRDIFLLIILALACTILPYVLHLQALKHISAFTLNLIVNLEPVYGIILAIIILQDQQDLTTRFYIGVLIIIAIVTAYPILQKQLKSH